ncbi:MAG TPA: glycosyl hydrolase [Steroidobacteraceae bacterium]|nr:glycosyl hydrolase [Steroidobacteraceae bacterium]
MKAFATLIVFVISMAAAPVTAAVRVPVPAGLGVYEGAGCDGVAQLKKFESWYGGKANQVIDFLAWSMLETRSVWLPKCWKDAGRKAVVFSVPMLPGDGHTTLADGASGKFDKLFRDYAAVLQKYGYGTAVIRIGWEFNGDWYPWAAGKDPTSWIKYWRRIVTAMRSVPGTSFQFDWCPAAGWTRFRAADAYPGDAYVDVIGLDVYNISWDPKVKTPEQRWSALTYAMQGLRWHRDFAASHGKAMSFPEWGTGKRGDKLGGGDDPYFIEHMADWMHDNPVLYHNYWDYAHAYFNGKLSDGHQPKSGAAFIESFRRQVASAMWART